MSTILITGCSRGLGLELAKQLATNPSVKKVFATSRSIANDALQKVIDGSNGRVEFIQMDVDNVKSIDAAVKAVEGKLGSNGIDILINNAAVNFIEPGRSRALDALEPTLNTNVVSVHRVSAAFLPLLSKGTRKTIVNMSSTMGSISLKDVTPRHPVPSYNISKAALNMLTAQYSLDLAEEGFTVFALSPGWLSTDLGGPSAPLTVDQGASATIDVILGSTQKDNGTFRNIHIQGNPYFDGSNPPW